MNKDWAVAGLVFSIVFFSTPLCNIFLGYRSVLGKRSDSDIKFKIYYGCFMYPSLKDNEICYLEGKINL